MPIIQGKVKPDSIVYSDCWRGYNVLDVSEFKHYRINHSKLFADKKNHINGIENFWNQAKRHMRRFNGVPKDHFYLFLKECEWRFNNPKPQSQLKQLKQWVKDELGWLSGTAPNSIYKMLPVSIFMAACLIETDAKREQVKIWNAGLLDVVIVKNSVVRDRIRVQSFSLGIMEACKLDGEMFGIGRLKSLLCQLSDDFSMTNIITQVNEFAGTDEQDDDITIIGFEKK